MKLTHAALTLLAVMPLAAAVNADPPARDLVEIGRVEGLDGRISVVSIDRASRTKVAEGISVNEHSISNKVRPDGSIETVSEYIVDCTMPQYQLIRSRKIDPAGKILSDELADGLTGGWRYGKGSPTVERLIAAVCND